MLLQDQCKQLLRVKTQLIVIAVAIVRMIGKDVTFDGAKQLANSWRKAFVFGCGVVDNTLGRFVDQVDKFQVNAIAHAPGVISKLTEQIVHLTGKVALNLFLDRRVEAIAARGEAAQITRWAWVGSPSVRKVVTLHMMTLSTAVGIDGAGVDRDQHHREQNTNNNFESHFVVVVVVDVVDMMMTKGQREDE